MTLFQSRHGALLARGQLASAVGGLHSARWLLLTMGAFAFYMGFIYNDCASMPLQLFTSHFHPAPGAKPGHHAAAVSDGGVYAFGVDPAWYHTPQELAFLNSLKMKLAVILGVAHMMLGIVLSVFNHAQFKLPENIWLETLPRALFMLATFGYMCFMVVYKWTVDWVGERRAAPNLIQAMIKIFLQPGVVEPAEQLYEGQGSVQLALVFVALLCIPVLFLGQPLYRRRQWQHLHRHASRRAALAQAGDYADEEAAAPLVPAAGAGAAAAGAGSFNRARTYESLTDASEDDWGSAGAASALLGRNNQNGSSGNGSGSINYADDQGHGAAHGGGAGASEEEEHSHTDPRSAHYSFGDDMIHQAIHAIEFILGAVSNTASYLRLWALSLAHAQLAAVFWTKLVVEYGLNISPLAAVVGVAAWAGATTGVLLCMDTLECFLHALRLHWVEFQNKFYAASGTAFAPAVLPQEGIAVALAAAGAGAAGEGKR